MEEEYQDYITGFFRKAAPFYNLVNPFISHLRRKVLVMANPKKGSIILDACTGTGKQAFAFGEKGFEVVGIDISDDMLNIAKKNNRFSNVSFQNADASNIPFPDNYFDVVSVSFGLHEMPGDIRKRAMKEISRVTKPKGTVMIVDYVAPQNRVWAFFSYNSIRIYESKYFPEFMNTKIELLAKNSKLKLKESAPMLIGCARIDKYGKS